MQHYQGFGYQLVLMLGCRAPATLIAQLTSIILGCFQGFNVYVLPSCLVLGCQMLGAVLQVTILGLKGGQLCMQPWALRLQ